MKSEDFQKVVALKHQNSDYPTKIFRDLDGVIRLATITRWYKRYRLEKLPLNLAYLK